MINKSMKDANKSLNSQTSNIIKNERTPNEHVGYYFSSFLKITDPNSQEILVQKRGDN